MKFVNHMGHAIDFRYKQNAHVTSGSESDRRVTNGCFNFRPLSGFTLALAK